MPAPIVSIDRDLIKIETVDCIGTSVVLKFFPTTARDFGQDLITLAEEAFRKSESVQQLTEDLTEIGKDDSTWEDIAAELTRKGYHK